MAENDKKEYRNWYKTLKRIQKKELILFGVLILLAFIFVGISSDICKWLKTEVIYDIVNNKCLYLFSKLWRRPLYKNRISDF